jgi:hypothetical protein
MTEAWDEAAWRAFADELDAWQAAGGRATFWWRDDDAGRADAAFERLLALATRAEAPLAVAVVPAWLEPAATARLLAAPAAVRVFQHGWAHANHEPPPPPGAGKLRPAECGATRPPAVVLAEAVRGRARLAEALGERLLPVFVPPWNRVAPAVAAALAGEGYRALSTFGPRPAREAAPGLVQLNTHADPIRWREGKRFVGAGATLAALGRHLADRRQGRADPAEPTGLLTHHRDMTEPFWRFLDEWLGRLRAHPAAVWPAVPSLAEGALS